MNNIRTFVLVLTTVAAASVGAQTVYSGAADQERRDRNREEALSNYRASHPTTSSSAARGDRKESMREKTHDGADSVRRGSHKVAETTRNAAHKTASTARRLGHKTAQKARDVTAEVDAKMPAKTQPSVNPEGINPVGASTKSPTAASNGIVK